MYRHGIQGRQARRQDAADPTGGGAGAIPPCRGHPQDRPDRVGRTRCGLAIRMEGSASYGDPQRLLLPSWGSHRHAKLGTVEHRGRCWAHRGQERLHLSLAQVGGTQDEEGSGRIPDTGHRARDPAGTGTLVGAASGEISRATGRMGAQSGRKDPQASAADRRRPRQSRQAVPRQWR